MEARLKKASLARQVRKEMQEFTTMISNSTSEEVRLETVQYMEEWMGGGS